MFLIRIVGMLAVIGIGVSVSAYLFTRDRRYLAFAWRITKYALVFALVVLSLFFLERLAVI